MAFNRRVDETLSLIKRAEAAGVPMIEINPSCPNVSVAKDTADAALERLLGAIGRARQRQTERKHTSVVGIKLGLHFSRTALDATVARVLRHAAVVRFVTCGNTIPFGFVPKADALQVNNGYGGIGGRPCKLIALGNARLLVDALRDRIAVIGCGGVSSEADVSDYLSVGCKLVQVGTALLADGVGVFDKIRIKASL